MDRDYYYWDCWILHEPKRATFHAFRLFADKRHRETGQQDRYSRLAYGHTSNLRDISITRRDIVVPSRDGIALSPPQSSIWTGCTIYSPEQRSYLLFYTERFATSDYWAHQTIRCATTKSLSDDWLSLQGVNLSPEYIDPLGTHFLVRPQERARTIHAWRDPHVFRYNGSYYMLVSAKLLSANPKKSASIALLRARDTDLATWSLLHPAIVSGYEELEVPQLFFDKRGRVCVFASTWHEDDYDESLLKYAYSPLRGDPGTTYRSRPKLLAWYADSFEDAISGKFAPPDELLSPSDGVYAGVVVPELDGAILGFAVGNVDNNLTLLLRNKVNDLGLRHPDPSIRTIPTEAT